MDATRNAIDARSSAAGLDDALEIDLIGLLGLECLEQDLFRGRCIAGNPLRAFGGQVAAQALTAAGRTVGPGRSVHSLHGYFLRAGDPDVPIDYQVERLQDGGSYSSRRVTAIQGGKVIFTLSASFKRPEATGDRQLSMPPAPPPEELTDPYAGRHTAPSAGPGSVRGLRVISLRFVPQPEADGKPEAGGLTRQLVWFKATEPLPDDPLLHVCALAYCSDMTLARTAALDREPPWPVREGPSQIFMASLDHAMWFHRPFRVDEWLLFAQRSPSASDGRGLSIGDFWTRDGQLVASVVQEAVLRPAREPAWEAAAAQLPTPPSTPENLWCH